jgi:HAD superfamily hydrolase (TIGR01509 family)
MKSTPSPIPAKSAASFRLPRKPRAVVFDLDGTLIDSEALVLEAYMAAADAHRTPFTHAQFLTLEGHNRETSERRMREYFGADFPIEQFYASVGAHIGDRHAPLKPGAAELMDQFDAAGLPYALATSSGRGWVDKHFTAHRLHGRFKALVTRDDVANGKPHPEPYLKASTALGHAPPDILAIEDSPTGVRSARAAGLMTVLVPDLIQPDDETRGHALAVVRSLHDIRAMLAG